MIRQAGIQDAAAVGELALLLWPGHTLQEVQEGF